jgi:serine protease Do
MSTPPARRALLAVASLAAACLAIAVTVMAGPTATAAESTHGYADLVKQVAPSVVTVMVEEQRVGAGQRAAQHASATGTPDAVGDLIRRLLSGGAANPSADADADAVGALGSGFIIRDDGLIVTNRHVVVDARLVRVRLFDGRELPAKILGADAVTDIALLKVDAGQLPVLRLSSSRSVAVGDAVIAIGNPFGLGQSVSAGIISARGRTLEDDPYIDFLQTDAAINRGNSGGPLLAVDGSVVGVTSAIFSPSGGSVGLGFAIPAETVSSVIGELEAHGRVERGYLGVSAQAPTAELAKAFGMQRAEGVLITAVDAQGPAAGALLAGDVLLKIGDAVVKFRDMSNLAARLKPQTLIVATILRTGKMQTVALTVGRLPDPPVNAALHDDRDTWVPGLRLGVAKATADIRNSLKAGTEDGGVIVTQLRPEGPGALAGLRVGDLITHAAQHPVLDPHDIAAVPKPSPAAPLLLRVVRDGSPSFVAVTGEPELPFP